MKVKGHIGHTQKMKDTITIAELEITKKLCRLYYEKYGKIPGLSWLEKRTNIESNRLLKIVEHLKRKNFFIVEDGKIVLNNTKKSYRKQFFKKNNWFVLLRYILLLVGVGAIYMSIYYSHNWLLDFLNPIRAFILAFIMVAFAVSSFELIVFFKQKKKYFLVCVFSFLWCIVTFFSMISTIAGQYNARITKLNKRYKEEKLITENNLKQMQYEEQKEDYREKKEMLNSDIKQLQSILYQYKKEDIEKNKKQYNSFRYKYNKSKRELNKLLSEIKRFRNKRKIKIIQKSPPDFYLWISQIFGWAPEMIQFWLSIFPAIFIDLIAPISIAIVMFTKK